MNRLHQDRNETDTDAEKDLADVRGIIRASGKDFKSLAADAKLNVATVSNIASGVTERPQQRTITMILKALGYRLAIARDNGRLLKDEVRPIPYTPSEMQKVRAARRLKRRSAANQNQKPARRERRKAR